MKQSNKEERYLFKKDIALLCLFIFFTVVVFCYAMLQIMPLTGTGKIYGIVMAIAAVMIVSIIWASIEVMMHLMRNQGVIYKEDLKYQRLIFEQNNKI